MPMFSNLTNLVFTGGTYTHVEGPRKGLDVLRQHMTLGAVHDSGERSNPPKCHPNTRVAIISKMMTWGKDSQSPTACLWFYGAAGAGKTAIGQTLAELMQKDGRLAASHFFCRTAALRNNANSFISTIAYQIALSFPTTRSHIQDAIEADPSIFERSLRAQLEKLVVEPLQLIPHPATKRCTLPKLVVIDGLDECHGHEMQSYLINIILEVLPRISNYLRFIIASRPEPHLRTTFAQEKFKGLLHTLDLASDLNSYEDIRLFLDEEFKSIKATHPVKAYIPSSWPYPHVIQSLVVKSSGQFIYASTAVKYIKATCRRPTDRLDVVLGLAPRTSIADSPFVELDALYSHIVRSAEDIHSLLRVLRVLLIPKRWYDVQGLGDHSRISFMEKLLFLKPGDVHIILGDLSSLVTINQSDEAVDIIHASFVDFLLDQSRSGDFFIDIPLAHSDLARGFIHCVSNLTSSTSSRFGQYFYFSPLLAHCSAAAPTRELYEDMLRLDLYAVYEKFKLKSSRVDGRIRLERDYPHLWHWVPSFFRCLKHSRAFRDSPVVYKRHAHLFDEYLKDQISKYHVDDRLVDFITLVTLFPHIPLTDDNLQYTKRACAFLMPDDAQHPLWIVDNTGLNIGLLLFESGQLGIENMPREKRRYLNMLSNFLLDSSRSGRFHVDGEKYAWAALRYLEPLCLPGYADNARKQERFQYARLLLSKAAPLEVLAVLLADGRFKQTFGLREPNNPAFTVLYDEIDTYLQSADLHPIENAPRSSSISTANTAADYSLFSNSQSVDRISLEREETVETRTLDASLLTEASTVLEQSITLDLLGSLTRKNSSAPSSPDSTEMNEQSTTAENGHGETGLSSRKYDYFLTWLRKRNL